MATPKAELAKWPAPIAGKCNFRKANHTRCKQTPKPGSDRCGKHQRAQGENHHAWKGGTSKYFARKHLPQRLLASFDMIVNDPEISSVRELIGLIGARMHEMLAKLETLDSRVSFEEALETVDELELRTRDLSEKDAAVVAPLLEILRKNLRSGLAEYRVWDDVMALVEQYRKAADTEQKREANLQANLTARQSIALFNQLFKILVEEIPDPEQRRRISNRLNDLLSFERAIPAEVAS